MARIRIVSKHAVSGGQLTLKRNNIIVKKDLYKHLFWAISVICVLETTFMVFKLR